MLRGHTFRTICSAPLQSQLEFLQISRSYSSGSRNQNEAADLADARSWFRNFSPTTIPERIGQTEYVKSSGPGGQKTNKTSSKAETVWDLDALADHVPKVLHQGLRDSRYYVKSSNQMAIKCDSHRSRTDNKKETHKRLFDEITKLYKARVPGVTSPEQKRRIEEFISSNPPIEIHAVRGHADRQYNMKWRQSLKAQKRRGQKEALNNARAEARKSAVRANVEKQKAALEGKSSKAPMK
ncbi:hypothetical protein LSUE1_G007029 [Lachnellula suecica]|uniref:Prokaryotic-type class I peptide chain release factors domain-containing protein n=1 Tax=Lachnellula suecica TaxID=602035 RepID=A0A8T9C364_9HELO|nr:hypothetical protein LSUE1_G007029 [Lachnellula suecica]